MDQVEFAKWFTVLGEIMNYTENSSNERSRSRGRIKTVFQHDPTSKPRRFCAKAAPQRASLSLSGILKPLANSV
jgi:hypothetical protein